MQSIWNQIHAAATVLRDTTRLDSYDSAEEFSLYHLIEISRLVDEADFPVRKEAGPKTHASRADLASEVEPTAADEDFAGHVV
jgi:hypothetical protein